MRPGDMIGMALRAQLAHRMRTALILSGVAIGVSAVILLTALGDSTRRYVTGEFASLGSNLVIILPGRSETTGGHPPILGETPRDLTIDDALSLLRSPYISHVAPVNVGAAPVSRRGLEREVNIIGSTAALRTVRRLELAQGRFIPAADPRSAMPVCVIGDQLRRELFGADHTLGEWLRIGDRRFRVIGVLKPSGVTIGMDMDDMAIIPVASAQALFNTPSLFRILIEARSTSALDPAAADIRRIITQRHDGEDDITIITQDSVIATFDRILTALTLGISGIATISLAVAGILIMNIMLISVTQRTGEIGLLRAVGAPQRQIRLLFIIEALLLSLFGALAGLLLGLGMTAILQHLYPLFPIAAPMWGILSAIAIALITGIISGAMPATRAARLDPVRALARH